MKILRRLPISATRRICSIIFFVCNTTTLVADVNFNVAWGPQPANNATNVRYKTPDGNSITLSWQPGDLAKQHDVYLGTSTGSLVYQGSRYDANGDPCNWTIADFNFKVNTSYYWRIDETNDSNVLAQGFVWKFTTHNGRAYNPKPQNGVAALSEPLQLSWTSGDWTDIHRVYFGTSSASVTNASTTSTDGRYRGTVSNPVYPLSRLAEIGANPPGASFVLTPGVTYYWRIDEVNSTTVVAGNVWNFTPAAYINIDDFEDYNSTDDVNANWPNGYPVRGCDYLTGNAGRALVRDANGKYLQYTYNNSGANPVFGGMAFSEAKRPYSGGTSFTGGGVFYPAFTKLRIDYRGAALNAVTLPNSQTSDPNADTMYVAIEDTAGNVSVYLNKDHEAQRVANWTSWYIKLADINVIGNTKLEAITSFSLGFGVRCTNWDPYFDGQDVNSLVMFDNIRLYTICGGNSSADFDRNNIVDWWDFDWIPEFWLVDYSSGYAPITAPIVDLYPDCVIDFKDFAVFANQWLTDGQ